MSAKSFFKCFYVLKIKNANCTNFRRWNSQGSWNKFATYNTCCPLISGICKPVKDCHKLMTVTVWGLSCWKACRTHADLIIVSLIHDEVSLWPTVNTTGNRYSTERQLKETLSTAPMLSNGHKSKTQTVSNGRRCCLWAKSGQKMKRTLLSGDKGVWGGV